MMQRTLLLSEGRKVRILEAGQGTPVFLLHGVGMRAEAWGPQIEALSAKAHVIAADMPGHGESDLLAGDPRLPEYVAWAAEVIEALGVAPCAVAGHSMGSLIAAGLAVSRPDLVARVALVNGVHRRAPEARAAVLARADEIAAGHGSIEGPLDRWFAPEEHQWRAQVGQWLREVPQAGYAAAYRAFAEGDGVYADRIGEITCPLLALTGEGDANSTPQMSETMAAMAPKGRATIIKGHRHMVNLTAAEAVSQEMRHWLEEAAQ